MGHGGRFVGQTCDFEKLLNVINIIGTVEAFGVKIYDWVLLLRLFLPIALMEICGLCCLQEFKTFGGVYAS